MGPGCTPVGVVPGGSANDFARRLGIPADPRAASRLAQQGSTRFIEYLMVNGRPLLTGGGVGLPVDIAARAEWWKGSPLRRRIAPGAAAYLAAALYVSARGVLAGWPRASAEIATPGRRRRVEALAILVGTDRTLGRFFRVWPPRELGDTGLGLCVIHGSRSRGGPLRILRLSLAGRLHTDSAVEQSLEAWVRLRFERPQAFLADGEILPPAREFTVRVASRPLEVLGPRGDGRDA
jgi:diacylglycerol kinase family enzyme